VFRNQHGLVSDGESGSTGFEAVSKVASALADEIARHYRYWDTRRDEQGNRMTPVGRIVLVGGSANLRGLSEYIAGRVQAPTALGDIWQRICNFDEYIPPIDRRTSLEFATAAGLALRGM
jgi:Tfp pilus assembly PilM family ATPase